jgi:hypothetical protein
VDQKLKLIVDMLAGSKIQGSFDDGFKTAKELEKSSGMGRKWITDRLSDLKEAGLLEVGLKEIENLSGTTRKVPAYRVKSSEGSEGKEGGGSP